MSKYRQCQIKIIACVGAIAVSVCTVEPTVAKTRKMAMSYKSHLTILPTKVIDLTQVINTSVPTYDGKSGNFKYETLSTVEKDGYGTGAFFVHEHFGTHIDAPVHFCSSGKTIDQLNPNDLILPAIVIDVRAEAKKDPDYLLSIDKIKMFVRQNNISTHSAVLLLTGWSKRYWLEGQYRNADSKGIMHFPGFSAEAAQYLIDKYKISAIGIDTLSLDKGQSEEFPVHKLVLPKGLFMVENLTNLDQLPSSGATAIFAPLKIEGGTGSPARVFAVLP